MAKFPKINRYRKSYEPNGYARQMGQEIVRLLEFFSDRVPDREINNHVLELAKHPDCWSAGHALFDVVRTRLLNAQENENWEKYAQYKLAESCLQGMYNESDPNDPFKYCSPYWIVPQAIGLANELNIPTDHLIDAIWGRPSAKRNGG